MTTTLRDLSADRQRDIGSLPSLTPDATRVLVAVAAELDMWEAKDMTNALNWQRKEAVLQAWEVAYEAVGGSYHAG
jgi:hypothetical protein